MHKYRQVSRKKGNPSRRSILVGENIEIWRVKLRSLARVGNLLPGPIEIVRAHPFSELGCVRPKILLEHVTSMTDNESHYAGILVLGRIGDKREAADHLATHNIL